MGFDHSIDNSSSGYKGGYNFSITGNAFKGSSEPGIVYVMQDTNGNTLPDDEWYELKGSEYGKEETVQDYAVTYYRPTYSGADVQWKDNQGVKGKIDYLKQYHDQPIYYPAWIGTDQLYALRSLPEEPHLRPVGQRLLLGQWRNTTGATPTISATTVFRRTTMPQQAP